MATKKTAKKAQTKASVTKTAPKPSAKKKPAAKESRASAPAAKKVSAKASPNKKKARVAPSAAPSKGSKGKVKSESDVMKKAPLKAKASASAKPMKPAKKQAPPKASSKPKAPPKQAKREAPEAELETSTSPRVAVGDAAPSFVLKDDSGNLVSSETLHGSPYVLYFYPKDDTPGCTLEACGFRDSLPRFNAKGVRVIGVSPDSPEAHTRFKKKYDLNFTLLSDPEKTLANAYGVWVKKQNYGREYMGVERSTFVVDKNGTVEQVFRGVKVPGHVDTVLDAV